MMHSPGRMVSTPSTQQSIPDAYDIYGPLWRARSWECAVDLQETYADRLTPAQIRLCRAADQQGPDGVTNVAAVISLYLETVEARL